MQTTRHPRRFLAAILIALLAVAGCATSGASSPAGATAPPAHAVTSPEDAAALVVASDPRFEGLKPLDPEIIGASRWWEASANEDGSFTVKVTIGWGDCPAGCINRHLWTYRVSREGVLELLEESGIEVPASLAP
ncbi:MAG TPA: hypothetical protein VEX41_01040 [Candidatus Eisenbacteria bacterium]|nr:hypothetical protein [Candidatus Eisenbacteria bacterium]